VDKKAWIIFGAVVVILFGGLIWYNQVSKIKVDLSNVDANSILKASDQNGQVGDHVFGSTAGKVTLIEYGDFQCPYCGDAYPQIKSVTTAYKDNVTFIFRNFPLSTVHPNALAGAAAAEAAGLQGKYWEMHDALYTNQSDWSGLSGTNRTNAFVAYAKNLGLDTAKFSNDLANSKDVKQKIAFDMALGNKLGINSTPTIYLDGTVVSQATSQDLQRGTGSVLEGLLNTELKKAGLPVPTVTNS
jgi:protein-disulfide isomerase